MLILTTYDLDEYVFEALRAGASGFLLKDSPPDTLISGIATVARGDALLAPSVTRRLITEFARRPAENPRPALPDLTPRETEVLIQAARGLSNREIAGRLFLGEATIKTYVGNILMKLRCRDRVQAVVAAYEVASFSHATTAERGKPCQPTRLNPPGSCDDRRDRSPTARPRSRISGRLQGTRGRPQYAPDRPDLRPSASERQGVTGRAERRLSEVVCR